MQIFLVSVCDGQFVPNMEIKYPAEYADKSINEKNRV